MSRVKQQTSKIACGGMLAGMLLLAIAGAMVVMSSPPSLEELEKQVGARRLAFNYSNATNAQLATHTSRLMKAVQKLGFAGYGSVGFQVFCGLLFAFLYNKQAVQPIIKKLGTLDEEKVENPHSDDFENGICGCFDDKWVLIHGLCCPLVRMAHTNAVAGVMDFWPSVFAYFCCAIFGAGVGPCCLMVHWRRQLKDIMRIEDHCFNDFAVTLLCPNLAICQQATAVDRYVGYEVTGCCTVEYDN